MIAGYAPGGERGISKMFPEIIAEIGINHEGDMYKAVRMIHDAHDAGVSCVKFQCHVLEDEYIPEAKKIIPVNAKESIWDIMKRCSFTEYQERALKKETEKLGMLYLSTPFSRAAAERLHRMNVQMYKIGSGECNNYPLVKLIASYGKPIILSTGMNDFDSITPAVEIIKTWGCPLALLHCVSMYPAPYDKMNLGAIQELKARYHVPVGLSDHSLGLYCSFAAVALGADIIERHFVSDRSWSGPDVPISIIPEELRQLVEGRAAIVSALAGAGGEVNQGERETAKFAYASVVSTRPIRQGESISQDNIWVKRPGTGMIKAAQYEACLGRVALKDIPKDTQLTWEMMT
jgi:N-acetylneuraminate synthase